MFITSAALLLIFQCDTDCDKVAYSEQLCETEGGGVLHCVLAGKRQKRLHMDSTSDSEALPSSSLEGSLAIESEGEHGPPEQEQEKEFDPEDPQNALNFDCSLCQRKFKAEKGLKTHQGMVHGFEVRILTILFVY